jgi:MinD-like ATPase involved in chromosome partitioning or flagellar assembly
VRTLAFYSFKGGTGRTLLLANCAKFLAWSGKRVVVLDLDLEAPGLLYKFGLRQRGEPTLETTGNGWVDKPRGIVDYILGWQEKRARPNEPVGSYALPVPLPRTYPGSIAVIPAGSSPSPAYAHKLSQIRWSEELFPVDSADSLRDSLGVKVFSAIKEDCHLQLGADYLLIDARTGLTAAGGVALNLMADQITCLMVVNDENLDGLRQILRSIAWLNELKARTKANAPNTDYTVIVSRMQEEPDLRQRKDKAVLRNVIDFLNEQPTDPAAEEVSPSLTEQHLHILHADRDLEFQEALRFDGTCTPNESLLLRDYYRVFESLGLTRDLSKQRAQLLQPLQVRESQSDEDLVSDRLARGHLLEWPNDPRESNRDRAKRRGQMIYLVPTYHGDRVKGFVEFKAFIDLMAHELARICDATPTIKQVSSFIWDHIVATRLLEGEFDFSGEVFFQTWPRSHLVGLVQYGWIRDFSLVLRPDSELLPVLKQGLQQLAADRSVAPLEAWVRRLREAFPDVSVATLGDTAAASECIQYLAILLDPIKLASLASEKALFNWLLDTEDPSTRRRFAVCDLIVADSLSKDAAERGTSLKWYKNEPVCRVPFFHPVPVGFAYPRFDSEWRGLLAKATLKILTSEARKWQLAARELSGAGIEVLADLKARLLRDLPHHEQLAYEGADLSAAPLKKRRKDHV